MLIDVADAGRLVVLTGRLDVVCVADVRIALHGAVDDGTGDLLLDARGIDSIDTSGLGVLVGAHRRAGRAGRRLVVFGAPPQVLRMLQLTRLDRVLQLSTVGPDASPAAPLAAAG